MKRAVDLVLASVATVVLAPFAACVALAVRLGVGSPVLFRQPRVGKGDVPFELVKFRTMTDDRSSDGELLPDAERLTPLGSFLRSTSLDELPELLLVIRGQMSLVGPRPLPVHYLDRYTAVQRRRHEVRPGVTGWAQVNGRNDTTWDERFRHDVWYVDNHSLWVDIRILVRTITVVFSRSGVSAEGEATMGELPIRAHGDDD